MSRSQTRLGSLFLVIVTHVDIDLTGCQDHKPDLVIVTHVDIDLTGCQDHKPDLVIVTHVDIDLRGCQDHKPDWVPCFGLCLAHDVSSRLTRSHQTFCFSSRARTRM